MNAGELVRALGGRHGTARCPAHRDRNPSLSVRDTGDGRPLVHCHAGCPQDAVIAALRDLGLWPERHDDRPIIRARRAPPPAPPPPAPERPIAPVPDDAPMPNWRRLFGVEPADFWDWKTLDERLLGFTARVERPGRGKVVLPVTWWPDGWRIKALPPPRPLYFLPHLADRPEAPVLIVEGEKTACASAMMFENFVCSTWFGGSNGVQYADWSPLAGRRVTIWPDADEPGVTAAQKVANAAHRAGAREVRIARIT